LVHIVRLYYNARYKNKIKLDSNPSWIYCYMQVIFWYIIFEPFMTTKSSSFPPKFIVTIIYYSPTDELCCWKKDVKQPNNSFKWLGDSICQLFIAVILYLLTARRHAYSTSSSNAPFNWRFVTWNLHTYELGASKTRRTWEACLTRNSVSHGVDDYPSECAVPFGFTAQTWPRNGALLYVDSTARKIQPANFKNKTLYANF